MVHLSICVSGIIHKLVEFWKSEGRVQLEYTCPVWHSSLTVAQTGPMAAITVWWGPSHTKQLLELGLDRLGPRRTLICKRFAERVTPATPICLELSRQTQEGKRKAANI